MIRLINPFDSHVHWQSTGELTHLLPLNSLTSPEEIGQLVVTSKYLRHDWLLGFGWDHNQWAKMEFPNRHILDQFFPNIPVAFTRIDGHAIWTNTCALIKTGLLNSSKQCTSLCNEEIKGGVIVKDTDGLPTGVLIDQAMNIVNDQIPRTSKQQIQSFLLAGNRIFNQAGITHIRNMSSTPDQWNQAVSLDNNNQLTLAVEQYFSLDNDPSKFDTTLSEALYAKKEETKNLRVKGIKVYFDGALGSDGALISGTYQNSSKYWQGLQLLSEPELEEIMIKTWENNLDIAIHAIGDEASHKIMSSAIKIWNQGYYGTLHLEHAEILRPETIQLMINHPVVCHMQPSHWLSDKKWINQKIEHLKDFLFSWKKLEDAKISFFWGSDSPIEPASLLRTLDAIEDARFFGITPPQKDILFYHQHKEIDWTPNTYCEIKNKKIVRLFFRGKECSIK